MRISPAPQQPVHVTPVGSAGSEAGLCCDVCFWFGRCFYRRKSCVSERMMKTRESVSVSERRRRMMMMMMGVEPRELTHERTRRRQRLSPGLLPTGIAEIVGIAGDSAAAEGHDDAEDDCACDSDCDCCDWMVWIRRFETYMRERERERLRMTMTMTMRTRILMILWE